MSLPHWEYFLAIESDLDACTRYVDFSEKNYTTFSIEFARIILASCSEIDTIMKLLCKKIDSAKRAENILSYFPIIGAKYSKFTESEIIVPRYKLEFKPWKGWNNSTPPTWWTGYNKIKHHRDENSENFQYANLENALQSVAGLLFVILYYYDCTYDVKNEIKIDWKQEPKLFETQTYSSWDEGASISWSYTLLK